MTVWNWIIQVWQFFDGKKTAIGTTMLILAGYLQGLIEIVHQLRGDLLQLFVAILAYTGTFLTGGGAAHKYVKSYKNQ